MTSPSQPKDIPSPRTRLQGIEDLPRSFSATVGTPPLRVLRSQAGTPGTPPAPPIANIPPRVGTPRYGSPSAADLLRPSSSRPSPAPAPVPGQTGSGSPFPSGTRPSSRRGSEGAVDLEGVPDEEKARVLRRHLVSRQERQNRIDRRSPPGSDNDDDAFGSDHDGPARSNAVSIRSSGAASRSHPAREDTEPFPMPYDAPGGDITHSLYKWQADQRRQVRPRTVSYSVPSRAQVDPAFEHIHEPGGFRRNYVLLRANEQGAEEPPEMSNNFIEFLYLFGHFAGEDLEEEEEEDELEQIPDEEEALFGITARDGPSTTSPIEDISARDIIRQRKDSALGKARDISESSPLIARSSTRTTTTMPARGSSLVRSLSRRRRRASIGPRGDATVTQAVLMLLKAFVGTGVLFLGKAFFNGGILFSTCVLVFIALVSLYSFLLLVKAKFVVRGSFGDIGGILYGPWMRWSILTSITISQIGFVSAYTIFVAQNLQAFIMAVTDCLRYVPIQYLILAQTAVLLPFALIRNIAKLSTLALVADVFILTGLVYIFGSEFAIIADRGIAQVDLFNAKDFPLLIGTAVFSFEGIGLVVPITDSMREPRKFPAVLTGVMLFLTVLFGGSGALAYATFGRDIQTVVIVNLDGGSKLVQAVQFLYSLAILLSVPLQLFPAVRIMENGLFTRSGKENPRVKWEKNMFRFVVVTFCAGLSWFGAKDLDKFVALVGSFACVPLCYVYPAMLHYKACAKTRKQKIADIVLMVFGMAAMVYTTAQTIKLMVAPESGGSPKFGRCENPPPLVGPHL
ncbi:hypothetical protein BD410DRAFT_764991 [Rickenella mellea]|uniref:Amino acid transporter transmembrane domain-containing protein n=1 Tax=Rickenella mellea TaxID=50990 RepID=A0A4Y7QE92_9AGAM|nr:hypothetical protein BD410DRAFT_764991 [Rickenella mellea]